MGESLVESKEPRDHLPGFAWRPGTATYSQQHPEVRHPARIQAEEGPGTPQLAKPSFSIVSIAPGIRQPESLEDLELLLE